jgi:formylglycine-generating enzyme required for sulfatase activity/serine/threonine protein kinase
MDRATHCPNCFQEPAPTPRCAHCGFDATSYLETNEILPLFTPLAGGKYRVGRVLGQGGFGVVYAGWVRGLKRRVAIKEFFPAAENPLAQRQGLTVTARPRYQATFADWKGQFRREAELLAQFSHPRIVQVHDILEENDTVYLIMERLEGQTLSDYLGGLQERGDQLAAGRALSAEDGQCLLHAALDALEALHGHVPPVLHRDLTPHNLFLVDNRIERLKVLDFGLARLGERSQSAVSLAVRVGNPGFAAPEQLGLYPGAITPATDFYTLGATLHTALAGVAPPNAQQRCAVQPPQSLPLLPNVDPLLAQVIRACLEISPKQRPQSVADIRKRLAAGTILLPLDDPEPIPAPPPPKPTPPPPKPAPPPGPQKPPGAGWPWVLLVAVLGVGAYALWPSTRPAPPPVRPEPAPSPVVVPPAEPRAYLTVRATPASAQVRIMNISPAYRDGIELIPGDFDIQVSAPGYQTYRAWHTVAAGAREVVVALQPVAPDRPAFQVFQDPQNDGTRGPAMVVIPAGEFWMGSPESEVGREPGEAKERRHRVQIERAFALGQREVTVGEFRRFVDASGYQTEAERDVGAKGCYAWDAKDGKWNWRAGLIWRKPGYEQKDSHPVVCVSWNDANRYAEWLAKQTGQAYRLPTEAEWEYAARAGTMTARYWGEDPNQACRYANVADQTKGPENKVWTEKHDCSDGYWYTAPVGSFQPNPWKLYDMLGNAWEWTCSAYAKDYDGSEEKCTDKVTTGPLAVRGGSWRHLPAWVRSAFRAGVDPTARNYALGFRLARSL